MAHIVKTNNNGIDYLRLVESYTKKVNGISKRTIRVLKNLGPLSKFSDGKDDYLFRLRQSYKESKPLIPILNDYLDKTNIKSLIDINKIDYLNPKNIGYFLLNSIYNSLGINDVIKYNKHKNKINYDLNGICKLLVLGRILNPKSKISTVKQNDNYLFKPANLDNEKNVYDSLDELDKLSDKIQKRIHTKICKSKTIKRSKDLIYYDVTNYYFESDNVGIDSYDEKGNLIREDLKKRGISKEKKSKNPIVQMGLFLDGNNIPISYKLFPGNHIDQITLRPALKNSIYDWNYNKVIIVADRGLSSDKNIVDIYKNNNGYVISKSIKRSKKEFIDWVLDKEEYKDLNNKSINDSTVFYLKSRIINKTIIDENSKTYTFKEKQVVYWSKAHWLKELKDNNKFKDYLKLIEENPNKLKDKQKLIEKYLTKTIIDKKTGKKIKNSKVNIEVNYEKLKRDISLLGYYCICSSELKKENSKIISIYKNLTKIENEFRIIKSNLNGRPIYVRTNEHINAHFLICFIALVILNIMQTKIKLYTNIKPKENKWNMGLTAQNIIKELNDFNVNEIKDGYFNISVLSDKLSEIFKSLNYDYKPTAIKEYNELRILKSQKIIL
jgi:transposase